MLRWLTNQTVMGEETLTVDGAWSVYGGWLDDPRVELHPEPRDVDTGFRDATGPFAARRASKWIGDCYLLAFAKEIGATLVTFDKPSWPWRASNIAPRLSRAEPDIVS